jgi:hypothetical protein
MDLVAHTNQQIQRLQAHFDSMIAKLRATESTNSCRSACIDHLQDYRDSGVFPINNENPGQFPIFKDSVGTYCAVGYLVAMTVGCEVADAIDVQYHNAYILGEIEHDSIFQSWRDQHGFTTEELAAVQPTYEFLRDRKEKERTKKALS